MAKPAFPGPRSMESPRLIELEEAAQAEAPETPEEAARRQWLDGRIREQYRDAATDPLPEHLLALIRKLRGKLD